MEKTMLLKLVKSSEVVLQKVRPELKEGKKLLAFWNKGSIYSNRSRWTYKSNTCIRNQGFTRQHIIYTFLAEIKYVINRNWYITAGKAI